MNWSQDVRTLESRWRQGRRVVDVTSLTTGEWAVEDISPPAYYRVYLTRELAEEAADKIMRDAGGRWVPGDQSPW